MTVTILVGDVREKLRTLADDSIHCCVTSPPYWGLRDYGVEGQIGLEASPSEFIATLVEVFEEVRRVLRPDGTCWINMGDSYASSGGPTGPMTGSQFINRQRGKSTICKSNRVGGQFGLKPKDLVMMPHRLAIALQDAGWWVRQDIVWAKPNPMPESVRDRCTKSHEYIFLLTKSERYYFDSDAIAEPLGESSVARLSQNVAEQVGSDRVPGKTNGTMKAVGRRAAGNKSHKGQLAYESGEEKFRTKAGLVAFAEREREKVEAGDLIGTRNKRSVWTMTTQPFKEAHFATFPTELPETCIKAGCPIGGTVLDPFFGAGTTGLVADRLQRDCIGIELNPAYAELAQRRIQAEATLLADVKLETREAA